VVKIPHTTCAVTPRLRRLTSTPHSPFRAPHLNEPTLVAIPSVPVRRVLGLPDFVTQRARAKGYPDQTAQSSKSKPSIERKSLGFRETNVASRSIAIRIGIDEEFRDSLRRLLH
jgi:hypothetical protein